MGTGVGCTSPGSAWMSVAFLASGLAVWYLVAALHSDHPLPWYLLVLQSIRIGHCSGIIALVQFVARG